MTTNTMEKGYDWQTAEAICNDAAKNTWEVRARGLGDKLWWTVSDSAEMTEDQANREAAAMRANNRD